MMIRMLTMNQIPEAMALVRDIFDKELAASLTDGAVASFHAFANEDTMKMMMQAGSIHIWGAFDDQDALAGVSAMNHPAHVSLLYVRADKRRQGISRQLLDAMAVYGVMAPRRNTLTVNALEPTIPYFEHVGFRATGALNRIGEVPFLPMSLSAQGRADTIEVATDGSYVQTTPRQPMPTCLKGLVALIFVTAVAIMLYSCSIIARKSMEIAKNGDNDQIQQYLKPYLDEDGKDEDKQEDESDQGIESIEAYRQKDLSYEIKNGSFSEQQSDDKYKVALHVRYPVLEGLKDKEEEINETIRAFAMKTEQEIYEKPDPSGKDRILKLDTVYVVNEVEYNVTYATDEFVSIVFNDASVFGEQTDQQVQVRTLNIDLTTGKAYKLQDAFDTENEEFLKIWEKSLRDEAGDALGEKLPELNTETDKKILCGEEASYPNAFFVDKEGVEIGFSLCKDKESVGWVTAPIGKEEIVRYKTDSQFWKQVTWQ